MLSFVYPRAGLGLLAGLLVLATACKKDSDTRVSASAALPRTINFVQPGLYPEGTQYDSQSGRFLVSSQTAGSIGQVTADSTEITNTSTYTTFADNDQLISTIGLNLDASRNRLLAAVSDPGYNQNRTSAATLRKLAAVAIFNRNTGTLGQFVNLSAVSPSTYSNHFANDIAIDAQGNAYVTDSYAPIIYKITFDAAGTGTASVWLTNSSLLGAPAGAFGLNGIVYHPSGYLLVAKSDEGKLLKIPIANGNPGTPTTVTLPTGLSLLGDDGLQLLNNTTLLVVCNAQGKVYRLATSTDFAAVTTTGTFDANVAGVSPYPTTLAQRTVSGPGTTTAAIGSYVLYAHLDSLQAGKAPAVKRFALKRVVF
jgi:sugar lactone lactonase YvrE